MSARGKGCAPIADSHGQPSQPHRPKCKTGPVLPPAPSEVPAGVSRPRSVPNRSPSKQAPRVSDPGQSEASFSPSLQTFTRQAPLPPVRTSFRQAGDHPSGVHPASRRLSLEHPSGKPAIVRLRLFSIGRTRSADRPFLSRRTLRSRCGLPSSKLSGRPFAIPLPEGSGLAGLRKSGFGFGSPLCLALLPGCPTRASLASFPKDLGPLGTGGVWSFFPVAGWSLLTASDQNDSTPRFAKADSGPSCLWITWITGTSDPNRLNHRPLLSPPAPAGASGRSPRHGRGGPTHRPRGPRPSPPPTSVRRSARARTPPSDNPRRAPLP